MNLLIKKGIQTMKKRKKKVILLSITCLLCICLGVGNQYHSKIKNDSFDVVVAVVDTGVDITCDVLKKITMLPGWDYYNNDDTVYDNYLYDYHGTYLCTTIAKLAPGISILPLKIMEASYGNIEDAIEAIRYAVDKGVHIVNCSWSFEAYNQELYKIIAENPDVLFVCAAGNDYHNIDNIPIYPCAYNLPNMINVLANDEEGKVYLNSGYGKNTVHIGASGVDIEVILPENKVALISGTPIATAIISSKAAIIKSNNMELSPEEIKERIIQEAVRNENLDTMCLSSRTIDINSFEKE